MYRALITYDGTQYLGWQKTRMGPSIQETFSFAIEKTTQEQILPEAASRTDKGVHAKGQMIAFPLQKKWDPYRLACALNARLPKDIRILSIEEVLEDFHPTLHATGKEYHYHICLSPFQEPTQRLYAWHFPRDLDLSLMETASQQLIGKHDFSAFANEKEDRPVCHLKSIDFHKEEKEKLKIILQGDRFLYKMARNLVGTLIYIGSGKLPPDCIPSILSSRDRKKAGLTAPAHGLFLHHVIY